MPARDASPWIGEAIESALAQTWQDFELIIVDDASSDSTLTVARSYSDPRVRVEANESTLGHALNHNRTIALARGSYVKFLHADDRLAPDCLEAMVTLGLEDARIGLVFARREVIGEDEEDPAWHATYADLHDRFRGLARHNDGRELVRQLVEGGLEENWIGEPSAVMVTRTALEQAGGFNPRVHQAGDLDLWLRIMIGHRVGFVDRPLSVYRRHGGSVTAENRRAERDWLDRLWLLQGLLEANAPERERIEDQRRSALIRAARTQVRRLAQGRFETGFPAYIAHRTRARGAGGRPSEPLTRT
jgi:glycosyltransferase involved in cell wall biosynthesis